MFTKANVIGYIRPQKVSFTPRLMILFEYLHYAGRCGQTAILSWIYPVT